MPATESAMQELGSPAADFSLPDVSSAGQIIRLQDFAQHPLLVMFICNHCPYVVHVIEKLVALANKFQSEGFAVVAISSNDVINFPQDGPQPMREFAAAHGFEFPYCYDETQSVAQAFGAACTPDFFIYDEAHKLRYRGQMDDSRPGSQIPVSGKHLDSAMRAILDGQPVSSLQKPSIGCSIKWKQVA